jgi:LysM repeat protein
VALLAVVESNPDASSGLEIGQLIKVPYNPNNRTKTVDGTIHRVGQKETLYSISKQYGVTIDELKSWNDLTDNGLKLGQELMIKNKPQEKRPEPISKSTHTVAEDETLYSISKKYGITIQQIKDWNYLNSNELKPGQVIFVKERQGVLTSGTSNTSTTPTPKETRSNNPTSTSSSIPITPTTSVIGTDEVHENGMVMVLEESDGNRKYLGHHRTVRVGTILRVKNNVNQKEVFVRIIGNLSSSEPNDVILRVSKSAYDRLGGGEGKFPVEVIYFK